MLPRLEKGVSVQTSRVRPGRTSSSPTDALSLRHMMGFNTASSLSSAYGSSVRCTQQVKVLSTPKSTPSVSMHHVEQEHSIEV